jgi:hypothetical protein
VQRVSVDACTMLDPVQLDSVRPGRVLDARSSSWIEHP